MSMLVLGLALFLSGNLLTAAASKVPEAFMINISQARVDDLKMRLSLARYPPLPIYGHSRNELGVEAKDLKIVIDYWLNEFDWKLKETELNRFSQYIVDIEGVQLHYLHIRSTAASDKPLLLFVHGWPSTSFDFNKMIPLFNEFNLLIPSLPGFPLSPLPTKAKFGYKEVWHLLLFCVAHCLFLIHSFCCLFFSFLLISSRKGCAFVYEASTIAWLYSICCMWW